MIAEIAWCGAGSPFVVGSLLANRCELTESFLFAMAIGLQTDLRTGASIQWDIGGSEIMVTNY